MFAFFANSRYMPCPDCGASLATAEREEHVCDPERRLDYQMFQLRDEIESFESEVGRYLDSSHGRFDVWRAERERTSDGGEAS